MASKEINAAVKHLSRQLSKHFIFSLTAGDKVDDVDKVYCVHCNKQFVFVVQIRRFADVAPSTQT